MGKAAGSALAGPWHACRKGAPGHGSHIGERKMLPWRLKTASVFPLPAATAGDFYADGRLTRHQPESARRSIRICDDGTIRVPGDEEQEAEQAAQHR